MQAFKPPTADLDRFPEISEDAAKLMGIQPGSKNFAHDVLRIEISGPKQDNLTVVDLPGIFHASNKSQTYKDKEAVDKLVNSYIQAPRSIILAVVSAKNDLNNQAVLNVARNADAKGARTLGIITKPDTLPKNSPSENGFIDLAKNKDIVFAHGWHVLRNRSFEESESATAQRDKVEKQFFNQGPWKSLDPKSKGIQQLRTRLSSMLYSHILAELPSLLGDIEKASAECRDRLQTLGADRGTLRDQKFYLLHASQEYVSLVSHAIDGTYTDKFFGQGSDEISLVKRLRAYARLILKMFAEDMAVKGHAVELVQFVPVDHKQEGGEPELMTYEDYYIDVEERIRENSGRELPGLYNHSIIRDLFLDQAKPWKRLLFQTKEHLVDAAHQAVGLVLAHVADAATVEGIDREIISPGMQELEQALSAKVEEVLAPSIDGHPFTLNKTFVENIQKLRQEQTKDHLTKKLEAFFSTILDNGPTAGQYHGHVNLLRLRSELLKVDGEDQDRFAAIECVNAMKSYYKVCTIPTFVMSADFWNR